MKIAICIPFHPSAPVSPEWVTNFMKVLPTLGNDTHIFFKIKYPLDISRNELVLLALDCNPDLIWWIDADSILDEDTFQKLYDAVETLDMVSAVYVNRATRRIVARDVSDNGILMHLGKKPYNKVVEVGAVGMGCVLMKAHVLRGMTYPWFSYGKDGATEDVVFCERARKAGFKIHLHTGCHIGHSGATVYPDDEMFLY